MKTGTRFTALTLFVLIMSCAPITQLQSPRVGRGLTLEGNATLMRYQFERGTRDTIVEYIVDDTMISWNLVKDTLDTILYTDRKPEVSPPKLEWPGSWYSKFGMKNRVEFSVGNLNLLSGDAMLKVNVFDHHGSRRMIENQAVAVLGGFQIDFFPRLYVGGSSYSYTRAYFGGAWGVESPVLKNYSQFELVVSPTISYESYGYPSEHTHAGCSLLHLNIPVGGFWRFGSRRQGYLVSAVHFRPTLMSSLGDISYSEWNREYKEGYAPQWGLDYSLFAFSGGLGVNFGTREMRKTAREARAKQGERSPTAIQTE